MQGTHSEPRRGEMSHICDISLLRVKLHDLYHIYLIRLPYYVLTHATIITVIVFNDIVATH